MQVREFKGWQYWYDHLTKCWWASKKDTDGNQIGDAIHAPDRASIKHDIKAEIAEGATK